MKKILIYMLLLTFISCKEKPEIKEMNYDISTYEDGIGISINAAYKGDFFESSKILSDKLLAMESFNKIFKNTKVNFNKCIKKPMETMKYLSVGINNDMLFYDENGNNIIPGDNKEDYKNITGIDIIQSKMDSNAKIYLNKFDCNKIEIKFYDMDPFSNPKKMTLGILLKH